MNILYYGVHEILEYDEVRLFRSLGHSVFSLGMLSNQLWTLRPPLAQDARLQKLFDEEGCVNGLRDHRAYRLTKRFIEEFDVIVVMNDASFIENNWLSLKARPVVWRTVGMGIEIQEYLLSDQRREGMKIVRYSPAERRNKAYLGEDAIIRFSAAFHPGWRGGGGFVLTFANDFARRYPSEFAFFRKATQDIAVKIGGAMNYDLQDGIGPVPYGRQLEEIRGAGVYFYSHGVHIPYTLNFIEAWSAGIPVVARDPRKLEPPLSGFYSEIADFIRDEETGFLVSDPCQANAVLRTLLRDADLARRIGTAGAKAAQSLFDPEAIAEKWRSFLESVRS